MSSRFRRRKKYDAHVRLYWYEMQTPAWTTLSVDAKALLVEFRALYKGEDNRIFLSVREMQRRLNIGQRRASTARDELLERGWIKLVQPGGFTRKVQHAAVYMLTNEPSSEEMGAPVTKDYMRWKPDPHFSR